MTASLFLALSFKDQFQNNHITNQLQITYKKTLIQLYTSQVSAESMYILSYLIGGLMILAEYISRNGNGTLPHARAGSD